MVKAFCDLPAYRILYF